MQLQDKVAIVTGAAGGLGLATVKRLVAGGAKAVMLDLPSSQGEKMAAEIGDAVRFVPCDVRNSDQVQAGVDAARELGTLAVAVNCAGVPDAARVVGRDGSPFSGELFERVVGINLIGTFNVVRLAAAAMVADKQEGEERGVIVNTASVAAMDGQVGQAAYASSKAGVAGMTLPLARDLAQHKIRVMTIAPGLFKTPMFEGLPPESVESLGKQVPHPARLGDPSEYAALVAHIIENPMLNGEVIRLDGAIRMAPR